MLRRLLFYRTFSRNNFALAVARYGRRPIGEDPYMLYACYRLGMYRSVADTPLYEGKNWRGGFARAVSLAACGEYAAAEEQTQVWLQRNYSSDLKAHLADCLAPFHIKLAHLLVQGMDATPVLRAAISLRMGEVASARSDLQEYKDTVKAENYDPQCKN